MPLPQINFFLPQSGKVFLLCLLVTVFTAYESFSQSEYYYDPPGPINDVNSWWSAPDDSGTHPPNFSTPDQQFYIIDPSVTLNADLIVTGDGSKVVVGNGSSSTKLIIPENFAYTGAIDVAGNATLEIASITVPVMNSLATNSTVIYNKNTGAANQVIAPGTYGNLQIRYVTPLKELNSDITVNGLLTLNDTRLTVTAPSALNLNGNLILSQTVYFENNVKENLNIISNTNAAQTISGSNLSPVIPCHSFSTAKSGGRLTLAASPPTSLDIANNFSLNYTKGAVFTVSGSNKVNVGGTFTLASDAGKNMPGGTFQNLTLNLSTGNAILQGDVVVNGTLALGNTNVGSVILGNNNLTVNNSIEGADATKYIITSDDPMAAKGFLILPVADNNTVAFPVGTDVSYTPCFIQNANPAAQNFSVKVFGDVLNEGTTGSTVDQIADLVKRTWKIEPSGTDLDVSVKFQWNAADQGDDFDNYMVKVFKYQDSWEPLVEEIPTDLGGGVFNVEATGITSFSEFSIGDGGSTLPVTWLGFTGEEVQKGVAALEWKTASELNNEGFEVQKSVNGKDFEAIGFVKGAGTTNEIQTYNFADEQLYQNTYYRLRQIDFDGKFDYSNIILVESSQHIAHPFSLYPNPVQNSKEVRLTYDLAASDKEQPLQLQLHDMHGRLLLSLHGSIDELNEVLGSRITQLPQSMYLLTLTDFATITHLKVLKQ